MENIGIYLDYAVKHSMDLQDFIMEGTINESLLRIKVDEKRLEEIVNKFHPYAISENVKGGYFVTRVEDATKPDKRRKIKRKSKKELMEFLADFYSTEHYINPTFRECFEEWNDQRLKENQISLATHYRNIQAMERCCLFADQRIRDLTARDLQIYIEDIPKNVPIKARAYSDIKSIIKGTLVFAKRKNESLVPYSIRDLFYEVQPVKCQAMQKKDVDEVFSQEETKRVIEYLCKQKDDIYSMGLLLIFITGIRIGELVTLDTGDFLSENGVRYIHIHRTESRYLDEKVKLESGKRQRKKGSQIYYMKDNPKTEAGDRCIPIPEGFEWLWIRLKAASCIARDHNQYGNTIEVNCVFSKKGWRCHTEPFRKKLYKVCDELGIKRKSPHKIRKTYGSILLDSSVDGKTVISLMGHSDINVTETFYHKNRKNIAEKKKIIDGIAEFQKHA